MCTTTDVVHPQLGCGPASFMASGILKRFERDALHQAWVLHSRVVAGGDRIKFIVHNDFDFDIVDFDEAIGCHFGPLSLVKEFG